MTLEEQLAPLMMQDRITAGVAVVFGSVALMLAAIGLYGVVNYGVSRRRGEIAIRMAVGASGGRVIGMILREASWLVLVGLVVGGGFAYPVGALIRSRLYGVAAGDPVTLSLALVVLVMVIYGAAYLPARRAAGLDAMEALRMG